MTLNNINDWLAGEEAGYRWEMLMSLVGRCSTTSRPSRWGTQTRYPTSFSPAPPAAVGGLVAASNEETPMPKFVIERQYLLPIYQRPRHRRPDITTAWQGGRRMIGKTPGRMETARATTMCRSRIQDASLANRARQYPRGQLSLGRPARIWAAPRHSQTIPMI
jgi:hypothetical protein